SGFAALAPLPPCSPFAALAALSAFSGLPDCCDFSAFFSFFSSVSAIDVDSRTLGEAHLLAVSPLAVELETDPGRFAVLGIGERDVREVDWRLLGDDAALLRGALALMALDHVDAAHQCAAVVAAHLDHLAGTALVPAGDHHDGIALPDLRRHHSTSGASE